MRNINSLIFFIVFAILMFAVLMVMYLKAKSIDNVHSEDFKRNIQNVTKLIEYVDLTTNAYTFAGLSAEGVYLSNLTSPKLLLNIKSKHKQDTITLVKFFIPHKAFKVSGDTTSLFAYNELSPELQSAKHVTTSDLYKVKIPAYLNQVIPFSPVSITGILYDKKLHQTFIAKYNFKNRTMNRVPLVKQIDGYFCSTGTFNQVSDKLFYTFYHRNQFICLDTNLNILYNGNTLDSNKNAKIKVVDLERNDTRMFSAPPLYVNHSSTANNKYLFICSGISGINDPKTIDERHSIIDCFNTTNGKYKYSFYIPPFKGKDMRAFKATDQLLYVLIGNYLLIYSLNI